MFGKKAILAAVMAGALGLAARYASADTISVHSVGSPTLVGSDADYKYTVDFDTDSNVIASHDGFMVIDFGTLDSYTLVASNPSNPAAVALAAEFTEASQNTGTGLSGFVNNTSNTDHFKDAVSGNTADPTDFSSVNNAVFFYNGATPYVASSSAVDLTLDLFSPLTGSPITGNGFGVDNGKLITTALSFSLNSVLVPSAIAPLPASSYAFGMLFGLVALGRFYRHRRVAQA